MAPATALTRTEAPCGQLGWSRWLSLTARILIINVLALALLAGGFFYLDTYRTRIIDDRMLQAQREMSIVAAALQATPRNEHDALIASFARQSEYRIRIYDRTGAKRTDSVALGVIEPPLVDPAEEAFKRKVARLLDRMFDRVVLAVRPDYLAISGGDTLAQWPEAAAALETAVPQSRYRFAPDRTPFISAAVPIDGGNSALLATQNARDITRIVRAERLRLGLVLATGIIVSVLLSLFLARTIVHPIRSLARAAVRVRLGRSRDVTVPRLPERRDEIGMLARAMSDMTDALRKRIDATDAFAADVSHELKNPIASLRSALEGLERIDAPDLRARLTAIAQDDVLRLDRLVTDIAEASRVDAQLSRTPFRPVDLGALIEDVILAREKRTIERGVHIAFARPRRDVAVVMGEKRQLARVFENLIDNAVSFSPDNGLVQITATALPTVILVTVEDEGPGVPPEEREFIFRRFHSVRPDAEHFGQHSGLGLAIARSILEGHHGVIQATDRPHGQRGARFEIRLPLPEALAEPALPRQDDGA